MKQMQKIVAVEERGWVIWNIITFFIYNSKYTSWFSQQWILESGGAVDTYFIIPVPISNYGSTGSTVSNLK